MPKVTTNYVVRFKLTELIVDPLQFKPRMPTLVPDQDLYIEVLVPEQYWVSAKDKVLSLKGYNYVINTIYKELNNLNTN